MVGVEPLHRLGRADDRRRRLAELDGQRIDDLDLGMRQPDQHRRQLRDRGRTGLQADAVAALAGVVQLELVILGDHLLGQERGRRRLRSRIGCGGIGIALSLQEIERHVVLPGRGWRGPAVMVAGAPPLPVSGPPRGSMPRPARCRSWCRRPVARRRPIRRRCGAEAASRSDPGRPAGATLSRSGRRSGPRGRSSPLPSAGTRRCRRHRRARGSGRRPGAPAWRLAGRSGAGTGPGPSPDRRAARRRSVSPHRTRTAATDGRW